MDTFIDLENLATEDELFKAGSGFSEELIEEASADIEEDLDLNEDFDTDEETL